MKQYRGMSINPCLNGFIVIVGCQSLVFSNLHQVAEALHRYADDPEATAYLFAYAGGEVVLTEFTG